MKALVSNAGRKTERVFLIGAELKARTAWDVRDSLDELAQLATTAGGEIIGDGTQKMESPFAATFIALQCRENSAALPLPMNVAAKGGERGHGDF